MTRMRFNAYLSHYSLMSHYPLMTYMSSGVFEDLWTEINHLAVTRQSLIEAMMVGFSEQALAICYNLTRRG